MEEPTGGGGPPEDELSPDACPNCGGPLQYEAGRAEGYCPTCGIYVEILRPLPVGPERPALVRAQVLAATKRELQDLCRAYGLKVSGNKTDVLTRLLRYMDDKGIDVPPDDVEEGAEEELPPAEPAEPAEAAAEVLAEAPPAAVEVHEAEAAVEDLLIAVDEEPVVSTPVYLEDPERLRRDRRRFYAGIVLTAVGGFGLLLGSLLHDLLRVPLVGQAYTVFGPLNVAFALLGLFALLAGLAGIGLGLRGGVVRGEPSASG